MDLSAVVKKDKKGYFCDLCIKRVYFKNKAKIWEEHFLRVKGILEDLEKSPKNRQ